MTGSAGSCCEPFTTLSRDRRRARLRLFRRPSHGRREGRSVPGSDNFAKGGRIASTRIGVAPELKDDGGSSFDLTKAYPSSNDLVDDFRVGAIRERRENLRLASEGTAEGSLITVAAQGAIVENIVGAAACVDVLAGQKSRLDRSLLARFAVLRDRGLHGGRQVSAEAATIEAASTITERRKRIAGSTK